MKGYSINLVFWQKSGKASKIKLGKNVAIIGGGLSAIDAARTAKRMVGKSGKVTMIYRRTKNEMPADAEEIHDLFEEEISLLELTTPMEFGRDKSGLVIKLIKMELKEPDESGRPRPVMLKGSEFDLIFDNIITAIGQDLELDFVPGNKLIINKDTFETQFPNIFAGGDAVRGADSLINAMSDGKNIAGIISIRSGPGNENIPSEKMIKLSPAEFQKKQGFREFGVNYPTINHKKRLTFDLVHPVLDDISAMKEAERCLYCDDICNTCVGVCPNFANMPFVSEEMEIPVYRAVRKNGTIEIETIDRLSIKQKNQILNIGEFCNECGNCTTFCPTSGDPYKIKPRFHLTEDSFDKEESGFYLKGDSIKFKENGNVQSIKDSAGLFEYESKYLTAKFSKNDYSVSEIKFSDGSLNSADFRKAAEMIFLLKISKICRYLLKCFWTIINEIHLKRQ